METNALRQIEELQRQRLEVYRSQVTPAWAWPSIAIAVFLFLSSYELDATWVHIAAPAAWSVFVGIWVSMITSCSGAQPRLRGMPKPLVLEVVRFCVAGLVIVGAAVVLGALVSYVLTGAVVAVATVVGGRSYDRRYRRRADALVAAATPA
jgi:hypothetical protein